MKKLTDKQINSPQYWDSHQTALDFGLRQEKYWELAGSGNRIAELGCGLSPFLSKARFKEKWGIDYSPKTIKTAKDKFPKVNYFCCDATNTPFKDGYFDVVVAGEIIEHLVDPEELIKEMLRIAKKMVIISTPHLEFEDPEHLWEFSEWDFQKMGFDTQVVHSNRYQGREYLFAWRRISRIL